MWAMDGWNHSFIDYMFIAFRAPVILLIAVAGWAIFAECRAWWRLRR
jgi:hypothetical protein